MLLLISGLNQQSKIGLTFKEGIHLHSHNYTQSVLCSLPCGKYFTALSPQATETWPGPGESAAWDGSKGMPAADSHFFNTLRDRLCCCCCCSVPKSCPTLCNSMDGSTPGLPLKIQAQALKIYYFYFSCTFNLISPK